MIQTISGEIFDSCFNAFRGSQNPFFRNPITKLTAPKADVFSMLWGEDLACLGKRVVSIVCWGSLTPEPFTTIGHIISTASPIMGLVFSNEMGFHIRKGMSRIIGTEQNFPGKGIGAIFSYGTMEH